MLTCEELPKRGHGRDVKDKRKKMMRRDKREGHGDDIAALQEEHDPEEEKRPKKKKKKKKKEQEVEKKGQLVAAEMEEDKAHQRDSSGKEYKTIPCKRDKSSDQKPKKKKANKKKDRWGQSINDARSSPDAKNVLEEVDGVHQNYKLSQGYEDEYDLRKVCVGGMPYDTSEDDIRQFFAKCGTISILSCVKFADTQRFKGVAFITFKSNAGAQKALELDGADMKGRFIKVEQAKKRGMGSRDPPMKVEGCLSAYVGNLPWDVQQVDVKRFFKGCKIDLVRLAHDKLTGEFRGCGHVDFSDDESLERAILRNQQKLQGRPIKVAYSVPKQRM